MPSIDGNSTASTRLSTVEVGPDRIEALPHGMARASNLRSRFGQHVRGLRRRRNLTLEQLGERARLNDKFLQAVETGKQAPTIETLEKLSRGLGVGMHELLALEERTPKTLRARAREMIADASDADVEKIVRVLEAILR